MSTDAMIGWSTLFKTGNGATPEVFTTFAEVTGITPPAMSRDTIDATHELSPEAWREFIAGLKDGGEVSFDMNFVPNSVEAAALMAELDLTGSSAKKNRQIVFPDGSYFSFAAILTGYEPDAPIDDKMAAAVTLKVSGKPTLVQA
ncbi:phage tail tube protein [Bradyrhizobium sp. BRP23]|uniref:phage tail tube protein n=1 Tax=Bradyrhizobium sp. BRP23 TaxID=2793820 RepID=UPI001CD76313|nr:phage tail tube protein [Bradyrhizobium sp. BRP23]MCA1381300.1 phage tail protein [Bradyrhizobium sp. BRP05]MCA1418580.1 phage tail protein [Bradyrhizobium sp. BRP23]